MRANYGDVSAPQATSDQEEHKTGNIKVDDQNLNAEHGVKLNLRQRRPLLASEVDPAAEDAKRRLLMPYDQEDYE